MSPRALTGHEHLRALAGPLGALEADVARIDRLGARLAVLLAAGGRLLTAGNGGSAAQAQHLTAELVGRYRREDRRPLSAIALHADTSSLTAIANDFGPEAAFARQVEAHGRPGDILVCLSTSGRSPNVLAAAEAARAGGLLVWALTGTAPNPLSALADDGLAVAAEAPATVQEVHQIVIHMLCAVVDEALAGAPADGRRLAVAS